MTATFPLPLPSLNDLLTITSGLWKPLRFEETSGLGTSEFLTAELAPMVWASDVELAPMYMEDFRRLRARIMLLDGATNTFLFASPEARAPQADPEGTVLGASAVKIKSIGASNKTLSLKGLPAGYVITEGDFLGTTYASSRRGLYVACATVTADGSGETGEFEVRGHIRPGTVANDAVSLAPPVAKVKIETESLDWSGSGMHIAARFRVRQTLRAG